MLYTDAADSASELRHLKSQVSEATSTSGHERRALGVVAMTHLRQLSSTRMQLGLIQRSVSQKATETEVHGFRTALERRLQEARSGRDGALANFNQMHRQALSKAMPRLHERLNRFANQQHEVIKRVNEQARAAATKACEDRKFAWSVTLVCERDQALQLAWQRTQRATHRLQDAFWRATAHEGSTLGRRLHRVAYDAEEAASKECAALQRSGDSLESTIGQARAELDAEAHEAVGTVRMEASRQAAEWMNTLHTQYRGSHEVQARSGLEHHAAHREARAAGRIACTSAEQARQVSLAGREAALLQRASTQQKEIDALIGWLVKRMDAAEVGTQAVTTAGTLSAPVDLSDSKQRFENEWNDLRARMETQRRTMGYLRTQRFVARARGSATEQVADVMRAVEDRCIEVMGKTAEVSEPAVGSLRSELGELLADVDRKHEDSLATTIADADAYERALVAPSLRDAPKHEELLTQLEHELSLQLQLSLSRPNEWFELLGRALRLDERSIGERQERTRVASEIHTDELAAHSTRATEEVAAEEALQARREVSLAADATGCVQRISHERRSLTLTQVPVPDLAAAIRAAVQQASAQGETEARERKKAAFERIDLTRPKLPPLPLSAWHADPSGRTKSASASAGAAGDAVSLDTRHHASRHGPIDVIDCSVHSELRGLRELFHHVTAEAMTTQPHTAAAAAQQLGWSEETSEGKHGLSIVESHHLRDLEAELAANLRETIREEHLEFAAKVKSLFDEREALGLSASSPPPPSSLKTEATGERVHKIGARVDALREKLMPPLALAANRAKGADSDFTTWLGVDSVRRKAFADTLNSQLSEGESALGVLITEREAVADTSNTLRTSQLDAREVAVARRSAAAAAEWKTNLEEKLHAAALRLESARKRLATAKRACAAELLSDLEAESEERALGLVKFQLIAKEASEWAWPKQLEALLSGQEADAAELAATRANNLEHASVDGRWSEGILPTLGAAGQTREAPASLPPLPGHGLTAVLPIIGPPKNASKMLQPRAKSNPLPATAAHSRVVFEQRPLLLARFAPKMASAALAVPPQQPAHVDVSALLSEVQEMLQLHGSGNMGGSSDGLGDLTCRRASLQHSCSLRTSLQRAEEQRTPSSDEPLSKAIHAGTLSVATALAQDAVLSRRRAKLLCAIETRSTQRNSLETQAARPVLTAWATQLAAASDANEEVLHAARAAHARDEERVRQETASMKAMVVGALQDRVRAEGATNGGLAARLWSEALMRRQAEEATVHARRLRQDAHAAAGGLLSQSGESQKEQLTSMRAFMTTVSSTFAAAEQEPHAIPES